MFCSYSAYDRLHKRIVELEDLLTGLVVDIAQVHAGEYVYPYQTPYSEDPHHSLVVEFRLILRNRDGRTPTTTQLTGCSIDAHSAKLKSLEFAGDPNTIERAGLYRTVDAGITREVIVIAEFELPISHTHIAATRVCGKLSMTDTRGGTYAKDYSAELLKNPVGGVVGAERDKNANN